MAVIARVVTYECEECGSEIVVTETGETVLAPIYCCGATVVETTPAKKKQARPKKKTAGKVTRKVAKNKVAKNKKPERKKK